VVTPLVRTERNALVSGIRTRAATPEYRANWDAAFGKKPDDGVRKCSACGREAVTGKTGDEKFVCGECEEAKP
jgi:CRISPR/Cas system-associated protein Cas10 (large subunit of type III CRISPR-Cas system)